MNVFTKYGDCGSSNENREGDEAFVKALATYLRRVVVPSVVVDLRQRTLSCLDGSYLTRSMHASGLNMRYLGEVAQSAYLAEINSGGEGSFVMEACEKEMVARAATHIFGTYLRENDTLRAAPIFFARDFLNALMNIEEKVNKPDDIADHMLSPTALKAKKTLRHLGFSAPSLWNSIRQHVLRKFKYTLRVWGNPKHIAAKSEGKESEEATKVQERVRAIFVARREKLALLRRVCVRCGVVLERKKYDLHDKSGQPIGLTDIANIVPVARSSLPDTPSTYARELLDRANGFYAANSLSQAFLYARKALSVLYQVCGCSHVETARCYLLFATLFFRVGDKRCLKHQRQGVALLERLKGVDAPDTIKARTNLALYSFVVGEKDDALNLMRESIQANEIVGGARNGEIATLYIRLGRMYRGVYQVNMASRCFAEALRRSSFDRVHAIQALQSLASLQSETGSHSDALQLQKKSYDLCSASFGPSHALTVKSKALYKLYTQRLVQARNAPSKVIEDVTKKPAKTDADTGATKKATSPSKKGGRRRRRRRRNRPNAKATAN